MCAMVVTAVGAERGEHFGSLSALLLANLALLLRHAGRRVLLADAAGRHDRADQPAARAAMGAAARDRPRPDTLRLDGDGLGERIERAAAGYDVALVDAGGCDGRAWRPALIAARLALVPLAGTDADLDRHYRLAAHLNTARMFNPGLRVLFVPVGGIDDAAAVRGYAGEVMAARVLPGLLDIGALAAPPGPCARDDAGAGAATAFNRTPAQGATAAALGMLVEEIEGTSPRPRGPAATRWMRRPALT